MSIGLGVPSGAMGWVERCAPGSSSPGTVADPCDARRGGGARGDRRGRGRRRGRAGRRRHPGPAVAAGGTEAPGAVAAGGSAVAAAAVALAGVATRRRGGCPRRSSRPSRGPRRPGCGSAGRPARRRRQRRPGRCRDAGERSCGPPRAGVPGSRWSSQVAASPARRATSSTSPFAMPSWSVEPAMAPSWSASSRSPPATRVCWVVAWSVRSRRVWLHSCRAWSLASRVTCLASWLAVAATSPAACLVSSFTVPARSAGVCGAVVWVSMSTPSSLSAVVGRRRERGLPGARDDETFSGTGEDERWHR